MFDMTELSKKHSSPETERALRRRRASETRLKSYGVAAITLAMVALLALLGSVVFKAANALLAYYLPVEVSIDLTEAQRATIENPNPSVAPDLSGLLIDALAAKVDGGSERKREAFSRIVASDAGFALGRRVKSDPGLIGATVRHEALMSGNAQLYMKGYFGRFEERQTEGRLSPVGTEGRIELLSSSNDFRDELALVKAGLIGRAEQLREQASRQDNAVSVYSERVEAAETAEDRERNESRLARAIERRDDLLARAEAFERRSAAPGGAEETASDLPSVFVSVNGGWARATRISNERIVAETFVPLQSEAEAGPDDWRLFVLETPEDSRAISDPQALALEILDERGEVSGVFNNAFFQRADSRNAESAGVWGAVVGSFYTMIVTFLLAFPIGVAGSIYLEEFAPKNRLTNLIEVNINNLAAVPSIVFGLLGLAVVLPLMNTLVGINLRSAPLIGGTVLALMSLPTIIIASRAALRAVPPSIREAALGVGASKLQAVTHHVLPLAMPGILTGTIIALAQALGETAPLLMIGMVAFIVEVPGGFTESATVLPVQVYRWSDFPERLFELKTSLAIVTLLVFLLIMNALAILLRKRFERRW